ncbi:MAG: SET domain-containing protein-lysine N-methyltransferase [Leptospiraceae bacterium]|nr:SET domain-containing protein-lysine N-methyltransferase [Leptospiraceae bacterium]MDW7975097.1 SET domain-containing protein-lysine N-methyltransferase [Leptospiraceae bacterium]
MKNKSKKKEYYREEEFRPSKRSEASLKKKVYVDKSPIHGLGVFAKRKIRKNEYIGTYEGVIVLENDTYVLWVQQEHGGWKLIDGKNELRYLNHSSNPNAEFRGNKLYAIKTIHPGCEITFHYGEDWKDVT